MRQISIKGKISLIYTLLSAVILIAAVCGCIYLDDDYEPTIRHLLLILAMVMPVILLSLWYLSYRMLGRALKPVDEIRSTAEQFSKGTDLSRRLPMPQQKDELYALSETFNRMFDRLEVAFQAEKQFSSDVSHELRTPLAVMISHSEYLLTLENMTEEAQRETEIILRQAKKMSGMISQLLLISRMEQDEELPDKEKLDMSIMAEIIGEEMEEMAEKRKIKIVAAASEECMILGNQTLLMQAFVNLVKNAVVYGKEEGRIRIEVFSEEEKIYCRVADDGKGIPLKQQALVWNRFYRCDASRTDSEGSGLGLPIVKWIVEHHGGEVLLESTPGEGTTVTMIFPKIR